MLTRIAAGLDGGEKSPFGRNAEVVRERRQVFLLQDESERSGVRAARSATM